MVPADRPPSSTPTQFSAVKPTLAARVGGFFLALTTPFRRIGQMFTGRDSSARRLRIHRQNTVGGLWDRIVLRTRMTRARFGRTRSSVDGRKRYWWLRFRRYIPWLRSARYQLPATSQTGIRHEPPTAHRKCASGIRHRASGEAVYDSFPFGGVAQPGRALRSQRRGHGFKSRHLHRNSATPSLAATPYPTAASRGLAEHRSIPSFASPNSFSGSEITDVPSDVRTLVVVRP